MAQAQYDFHATAGSAIQKWLLDQAARDRQDMLDRQAEAHRLEAERVTREEQARAAEAHKQALELQQNDLALKKEQLAETKRKNVTTQLQETIGMGNDVNGDLLKRAQESVPGLIHHVPGQYEQGAQTGEEEGVPLYDVTQTAPERNTFTGTNEQQKIRQIVENDPVLKSNPEIATMLKIAEATGNYTSLNTAISMATRPSTQTSLQKFTGRRANAPKGSPDELFLINPKTGETFDSQMNPVHEQIIEGNPAPGSPFAGLMTIKGIDEYGNPIETVVPKQVGAVYHTTPGDVVENRIKSAQTVILQGDDVIKKLNDPAYMAQLGPVMGRYNDLRDFIGNPPPEYAELAGAIESIAMANMGVHGFRAMQGVTDLNASMSRVKTPEALAAYITGLHSFARDYIAGNRVKPLESGAGGGGSNAPKGETDEQRRARLKNFLPK